MGGGGGGGVLPGWDPHHSRAWLPESCPSPSWWHTQLSPGRTPCSACPATDSLSAGSEPGIWRTKRSNPFGGFKSKKQPLIRSLLTCALPQRDFSHDVHVVDLREVQRAWDGRGHHHLKEEGEVTITFMLMDPVDETEHKLERGTFVSLEKWTHYILLTITISMGTGKGSLWR